MTDFQLDPRLAADSELLALVDGIEIRAMLRVPWPWLLLVPRVPRAVELFDLDAPRREALWRLALACGEALKREFAADKINVGALGNVVPQLHVHVLARHRDDPAWPGPVWGRSVAPPEPGQEQARVQRLRALVAQNALSMPGRASAASHW